MSFFSQNEIEQLTIDQMVFHLIGPNADDFVRLEAIEPGEYSDFFIERIVSANSGIPYSFTDASATRTRLNRIAENHEVFQVESELLAEDFHLQHGGSAAAGAFLIFVLSAGADQFFALLKYDDETVLSYELEELEDGRKRVSLDSIDRTFVQNRDALQKSAIVRLTELGGDLVVLDRQNQQKVARYFENFLAAKRQFEDAEITKKLVDVTRRIIRDNRDLVPEAVFRERTRRTYEAASAGGQLNIDNQKSFLDTVFGQQLADDHPIIPKYRSALRRARIEAIPVRLDAADIKRPSAITYTTQNQIQIRVPRQMTDLVVIGENSVIINDTVTEETDDTDATR